MIALFKFQCAADLRNWIALCREVFDEDVTVVDFVKMDEEWRLNDEE